MSNENIKTVKYFDDRFYRFENQGFVKFYPSVTTVLGVEPKKHLLKWYADLGWREAQLRKQEAADEGSAVHHAAQAVTEGGIAIFNPKYRPEYTDQQINELKDKYSGRVHVIQKQELWVKLWRFVQWVQIVKPVHIASEVIVWDDDNEVAGSLDYYWYIKAGKHKVAGSKEIDFKEGLYVVDLKSGKNCDRSYNTQTAKYYQMLQSNIKSGDLLLENGDVPKDATFVGTIIIHVDAAIRTGIQGLNTHVQYIQDINEEINYFDNHLLPVWRRNNTEKPKVLDMPISLTL